MDETMPVKTRHWWIKLWPLLALALGLLAYFYSGLGNLISFEQLKLHRGELTAFVAHYPIVAIGLFVVAYAIVVAFSLPIAAFLSVLGGFLFGSVLGTAGNVVGATIGAVLVFLAAKTAFGDFLRQQAGPFVQRMEAGFKENALSYMLVLRLVPALPFFIVNIVPALLNVRLSTFALGTLIGIIPGAFVFASIGAGLGSVFDKGGSFTLSGALTPEIITALVGLALLSLLPVAYKSWRGQKRS